MIPRILHMHFAGIGQSLANRITLGHGNLEEYMTTVQGSFAITPLVQRRSLTLPVIPSIPALLVPDGIDPLVGKRTIDHTAGIISDIHNSSIDTGKIPSDLKKTKTQI